MNQQTISQVAITGFGAITPFGLGVKNLLRGLRSEATNFSITEFNNVDKIFSFPIAKSLELNQNSLLSLLDFNSNVINKIKRLRNLSKSACFGIYCALEAWNDAGLFDYDLELEKVAIISAGSNTQQSTLKDTHSNYSKKLSFLNPSYALYFFDTDLVGALSSILETKGEGYSMGSASASGNLSLIQGFRLIQSGEYDVVVIVAPLMDISIYEYQGFTSIGAMAGIKDDMNVSELCCPFDMKHSGFVYGQNAGAIILESSRHMSARGKKGHGFLESYGFNLDGNRNPNPNYLNESKAMNQAINRAGLSVKDIDYINTHGTSSPSGDKAEIKAIIETGLQSSMINSTKSLIGHGITSAGVVEAIATIIQMKNSFIHSNKNLLTPIEMEVNLLKTKKKGDIKYALSNSFGFGGVNTSLLLAKS